MSERDGYQHGVPCWISGVFADPEKAAGFYTELFGWTAEDVLPADEPGSYFVCKLRGRDVAALGTEPGGGAPRHADWGTCIWVDEADATAEKVTAAGGGVIIAPFDLGDLARMAIVKDPQGAILCLWQPRGNRGAQLVNEPSAWSMSPLTSPDPEASKSFYGDVFGWTTDAMDLGGAAEITMFLLPGFEGGEPSQPVPREVVATMVPSDPSAEEQPAHWSVDFWVDGLDATVARASELGGKTVVPPYEIPGVSMTQAVLADPEGASFSATQLKIPS
jgi:predicted enzyme related to lactoylglutathione lyase